jgi:hypothetical protein
MGPIPKLAPPPPPSRAPAPSVSGSSWFSKWRTPTPARTPDSFDGFDELAKSRNSFGAKKRKAIPKSIIKQCKKLKIKTTMKRGNRRVKKSLSVLKRQIKKALKNKK